MSKRDYEHHQPRKSGKKKKSYRNFNEDAFQDERASRVNFKNYLRQLREEELMDDNFEEDDE
mgnify:CR=1 FL=1